MHTILYAYNKKKPTQILTINRECDKYYMLIQIFTKNEYKFMKNQQYFRKNTQNLYYSVKIIVNILHKL